MLCLKHMSQSHRAATSLERKRSAQQVHVRISAMVAGRVDGMVESVGGYSVLRAPQTNARRVVQFFHHRGSESYIKKEALLRTRAREFI